jgi:hypothetical protein
MRRVIELLGAVEQGLRRNTTYVKAGTAEGVLLKEHYIFTGLGSFLRGCIARRASTNDG